MEDLMKKYPCLQTREGSRVLAIYMYLDWVNNFITVERFASYYSLSNVKAKFIIDLGRTLQEECAKLFKVTGVNLYVEFCNKNEVPPSFKDFL